MLISFPFLSSLGQNCSRFAACSRSCCAACIKVFNSVHIYKGCSECFILSERNLRLTATCCSYGDSYLYHFGRCIILLTCVCVCVCVCVYQRLTLTWKSNVLRGSRYMIQTAVGFGIALETSRTLMHWVHGWQVSSVGSLSAVGNASAMRSRHS